MKNIGTFHGFPNICPKNPGTQDWLQWKSIMVNIDHPLTMSILLFLVLRYVDAVLFFFVAIIHGKCIVYRQFSSLYIFSICLQIVFKLNLFSAKSMDDFAILVLNVLSEIILSN